MDARKYLRSLLEYNTWANAELYAKVRELPPEEVTKKRKTLLESIHVSMNHLLSVDMMWHAHMEKRPHGISHGSYHRGWIADMFGQAESPPPIIDIPVYERAVKANNLNPLP